jgi:hypothetical protein
MDRAGAEAFLAEPRIMLLATNRGGKEPFLVAVWHEYRDGSVVNMNALRRRSPLPGAPSP